MANVELDEIVTSPETIRVSSSYLTRTILPDIYGGYGYLFTLGEHVNSGERKNIVRPIGGAWKSTDHTMWRNIGFIPEREDGDLRGSIGIESLSFYRELLRSGSGRESNGLREWREEVGGPLHLIGEPGFTQEELAVKVDVILKDSKSFVAPSASGITTQYDIDIFDATISDEPLTEKIQKAIDAGTAHFCVISQNQIQNWIRTGELPLVSYGGNLIEVEPAPTCSLVREEKIFSEEAVVSFTDWLKRQLRDDHLLSDEDFDLLRKCMNPAIVDDLEKHLNFQRRVGHLAKTIIGPLSEGAAVYAGAVPQEYRLQYLFACFGGMYLRDVVGTMTEKNAFNLIVKDLSSLLQQFAKESEWDRIPQMSIQLASIVHSLANGEELGSPV